MIGKTIAVNVIQGTDENALKEVDRMMECLSRKDLIKLWIKANNDAKGCVHATDYETYKCSICGTWV